MLGSKYKTPVNLLDLVPEQAENFEVASDGHINILVPKYGKNPLGQWLATRLNRPYIRIKLDRIGSFVWQLCDGRATVREIARRAQAEFGEEIEPVYERLGEFMKQLDRNRFIRWKKLR